MRTRECEAGGIVIESVIRTAGRVAGQASIVRINIAHDVVMIVVRLGIGMANGAAKLGVVVWVQVAIRAGIPFAFMRTGVNREKLTVVVFELGRRPAGIQGVTGGTIGRKLQLLVIGVLGVIVIFLVAGHAVGGQAGKSAVGMALVAISYIMATGEREEVVVKVVRTPTAVQGVVTFDTVLRETTVIRHGGFVILLVTVNAFVSDAFKHQRRGGAVALQALQMVMRTN